MSSQSVLPQGGPIGANGALPGLSRLLSPAVFGTTPLSNVLN